MNEPVNLTSELCPVDGAVCDRKCGFKAHATLRRKADDHKKHEIRKCEMCNEVIAQCGCMGEKETIVRGLCAKCKGAVEGEARPIALAQA